MAALTSPLRQKIFQAKMVIEDALENFPPEKSLIAWSGGKDSTLLLWLLREVCNEQRIASPKALDIDQSDPFPELIEFRDRLVADWGIDLVVVRNDDFLDRARNFGDHVRVADLDTDNRAALAAIGYDRDTVAREPESPICNHLLKTVPINKYLRDNGIAALYTGIRWDEHGAREKEIYLSPRENPDHVRVHPLLHFTERDIWDTTFALGIPYNGLYIQGYRSLDTQHGTLKQSDVPAWDQNLEGTSEREGRSEEKEKMMAQLRAWGYM